MPNPPPGATPLDIAALVNRVLKRNIQFPDQTFTAGTHAVTALMRTLLGNAAAGAVDFNLLSAVGVKGMRFTFKKVDSTGNPLNLAAAGGETIDGAATATLTDPNQALSIESDGANWRIVSNLAVDGPSTVVGMLDTKAIIKDDSDFSSLDPVPGTTIVFATTRAGVSILTASAHVSGNHPVPSDTFGINVDGVPYTLSYTALNNGSGGDSCFGFGFAGSIGVPLAPGVHTAFLFVTQSGLGFVATPTDPMTLSVIFPTANGSVVGAASLVKQEVGPLSQNLPGPDPYTVPPGGTINVPLGVPQTVIVSAYATLTDPGSNTCNGQIGIRVNGVDLDGTISSGGNDLNKNGLTITRAVDLPAGDNVIEFVHRTLGGTASDLSDGYLTVVYNNPVEITPTPEAATLVVHGTVGKGDYTTIAAALAGLPAGGGKILVREGTYALALTNSMPNKKVVIEGCGDATIIDLGASAIPAFTVPNGIAQGTQYTFRDFQVKGNGVAAQELLAYQEANSNAWVRFERVNVYGTLVDILDIQNYDQTFARTLRVTFEDCTIYPVAGTIAGELVKSVNAAGDFTGAVLVAFRDCVLNNEFDLAAFGDGWAMDAAVDLALFGTVGIISAGCAMNGLHVDDCKLSILGGDVTVWGTVSTFTDDISNSIIFGFDFGSGLGSRLIYKAAFLPNTYVGTVFSVTGVRIEGGADPALFTGCYFPGAATTDTAIDIDGRPFVHIGECEFGDPFGSQVTQAVKLKDALDATIVGCHFNESGATKTVVETGTTNRTRIQACSGLQAGGGMTIIGPDTVVEGAKRKDQTDTTADAYATVVDEANPKGLKGVGTILNTDGANSLTVKETVTDAFGNTASLETPVAAGAPFLLDTLDAIMSGGVGTAYPSFKTYKLEVKSTTPGSPATYELHFTTLGAT